MEKNGGPAFPASALIVEDGKQKLQLQEGMTLRDYFAAKVMQGMLASQSEYMGAFSVDEAHKAADMSYKFADAMLKAREM
jgi:hypothetical protein